MSVDLLIFWFFVCGLVVCLYCLCDILIVFGW